MAEYSLLFCLTNIDRCFHLGKPNLGLYKQMMIRDGFGLGILDAKRKNGKGEMNFNFLLFNWGVKRKFPSKNFLIFQNHSHHESSSNYYIHEQ